MKILLRMIVVLGFVLVGFVLGILVARFTDAAAGSGLAGGAIVLGYGVIGAAVALVLGIVVGLRLPDPALRRLSVVMGAVSVLFIAYVAIRIRAQRLANEDPPEAYMGIPEYSLTLERTANADPVLAKLVSVSSTDRRWTTTLPDDRVCKGTPPAAVLRETAEALQSFLDATNGAVECEGGAEEILRWRLDSDGAILEGNVQLNEACLVRTPSLQPVVLTIRRINLESTSSISCK